MIIPSVILADNPLAKGTIVQEQEEMIAADAARYLGVSPERISALVRSGRLVGRMIAGRVRVFTHAELDAYRAQAATNKGGRPKEPAGTLAAVTPA